jgi:Serine/threonine protein phosphatase
MDKHPIVNELTGNQESLSNPGIFKAQALGKRQNQEDRLITAALESEGYTALAPARKVQVFKTLFDELDKKCAAGFDDPRATRTGGSTLTTCIATGNRIDVAYVGDSPAYLLYVKRSNFSLSKLVSLNPAPHTLANKEEAKRILYPGSPYKREGKYITNPTIDSEYRVELTRCIGGWKLGPAINSEPEVLTHQADPQSDEIAILIVASDGIIPGVGAPNAARTIEKAAYDANIRRKFHNVFDIDEFLGHLVEEIPKVAIGAFHSQGNCSVAVTCIESTSITPKVLTVADGHGGEQVVQTIAEHFLPTLEEAIALEYKNALQTEEESPEEGESEALISTECPSSLIPASLMEDAHATTALRNFITGIAEIEYEFLCYLYDRLNPRSVSKFFNRPTPNEAQLRELRNWVLGETDDINDQKFSKLNKITQAKIDLAKLALQQLNTIYTGKIMGEELEKSDEESENYNLAVALHKKQPDFDFNFYLSNKLSVPIQTLSRNNEELEKNSHNNLTKYFSTNRLGSVFKKCENKLNHLNRWSQLLHARRGY